MTRKHGTAKSAPQVHRCQFCGKPREKPHAASCPNNTDQAGDRPARERNRQ